MKDEEYIYRQDVGERAKTARSAHNKRTHCGKGGRVKLPSDYMTKKEIKAMSGEVKTYRLNEPMKWEEFKAMPDDIKRDYVNLIRKKFNAPDTAIAEMLGVHKITMAREVVRFGIGKGNHSGGGRKWDKEGFLMWVNGVPVEQAELPVIEETEEPVEQVPVQETPVMKEVCSMPTTGQLTFEGNVDEICNTLKTLLNGASVRMFLKWNLMEVDDG